MKSTPHPYIYRATFDGLRPQQAKLNMAVPGRFTIEIFQTGQHWKARYVKSKAAVPGLRAMTHIDAQGAVELMFQNIIEPWERIEPAEVQP